MKSPFCFALLASFVALIVATPAFAERACLQIGKVYSWRALDDKTVVAKDTLHKEFKVSLSGHCPNLKNNISIGLNAHANSALDCVRRGDSIVVKAFNSSVSCMIGAVEPAPAQSGGPG